MQEEELITLTTGARKGGDRRVRVLNDKALTELVQKDAKQILLRLSSEGGGLDELLKNSSLSDSRLSLFIEVIGKSFTPDMWSQLQQNIRDIVNKMLNTEFLNPTLYSYVSSFVDGTRKENSEEQKRVLSATVSLLRYVMEISPQFAYPKVMHFQVLLRVLAGGITDETILYNLQRFDEMLKQHDPRGGGRDEAGATGGRTYGSHGMRINQDHEQPEDNFRALPLIPTEQDLTAEELGLRRNRETGRYANLHEYLDVQFRLFRADLVLPLKESIQKYLGNHDGDAQRGGGRGVRAYHDVQIMRPVCTDREISYRLWFDVGRLGSVDWRSTQRLKYGSLVCLSRDNFQTNICALVQERDATLLENGLVDVTFILTPEKVQQITESSRDHRYIMVESPAYFEAYRHVLQGLQNLNEQNFPFVRYIVDCNPAVNPPAYLQHGGGVRYDFQPLLNDDFIIKDQADPDQAANLLAAFDLPPLGGNRREVEVMSGRDWPTFQELKLDDSQYKALHNALTREFAIIQGPPGTGKTHLGLKIFKMLLHNAQHWNTDADRKRPILVVCYTNHALDQFLEGILKFFKGTMVRVGARSKSEIMKEINLASLRVRARENRKVPMEVHEAKIRAKMELRILRVEVHGGALRLEIAEQELVNEFFLEAHISKVLMESFQRHSHGGSKESAMLKWLKLEKLHDRLMDQAEHNLPKLPPHRRAAARQAQTSVDSQAHAYDYEDEEEDEQVESIDITASFRDDNQSRRLDDDDDSDNDFDLDLDMILEAESEKEESDAQRTRRLLQQLEVETLQIREDFIALSITEFCRADGTGLKDRTVREPYKPSKEQNKKVAENFRKLRLQYKRWLQGQLRSTDRMSLEEADKVKDLWKMTVKDRWRMYRLWVDLFCKQTRGEIRDKEQTYHDKAQKYREILYQEDNIILRNATIIGMTTTGAARYQSVLQDIGPRIIIVEEAAEVFEAHVVATLSRDCQHVILIGDHKQLRPNPIVHELAKKCNLDVSLFERMVRNQFQFDCLEYQHRMRPEISRMMRLPELYPKLKDHDVVMNYPPVLGVRQNVFYINHSRPEEREDDTKSFSNEFEAKFMVALCGYLMKQNYRSDQITILTPYSGQIRTIGRLMSKRNFEGVRVSSVDNFQGEENDIILLSLVRSNSDGDIGFLKMENRMCVALSRAKIGLYVIGNFEVLKQGSKLLENIVTTARAQRIIDTGLPLACQNHIRDAIIASTAEDFNKAPEGGCRMRCSVRLPCGHCCPRTCHPGTRQDHDEMKCSMTCAAQCPNCGQVCKEKHECCVHEHCMNLTEKVVPRCQHKQMMPCGMDPMRFICKEQCDLILDCGHRCQSSCGEPHTVDCGEMVPADGRPCQHMFHARCSERTTAVCVEPCRETLVCSHTCEGSCGDCSRGRLHVACKQQCQKILVCQHNCEATCCQCPPCEKTCQNRCHHSQCDKKCGQPCYSCRMPCEWKCKHQRCNKLCSEQCDRERCNQPCKQPNPECGHPCIGLCGETCPPFCRRCDAETLKSAEMTQVFGEPEDDDRFVFLEDCCHVFVYQALDTWVEKFSPKNPTSQNAEREESDAVVEDEEHRMVKMPECPQCKTPIRKNLRYGNIIKSCLEEIETIKRRCLGDQDKINALERKVEEAKSRLPHDLKTQVDRTLLSQGAVKCEPLLAAQFYQITQLIDINQLLRQVSSANTRWPDKRERYQPLQCDLENFMAWTLHPRNILSTQEVFDARQEFQRLRILTHLLHCRHAIASDDIHVEARIMRRLAANIQVLIEGRPVQENDLEEGRNLREELQNVVPDPYSALTDEEREAIVKAVSLPTGHWYACPRGHYYVIGECGRPNQVAECPECRGVIGGEAHALAEGNRFAPEFDNAEGPVWSVERDEDYARELQEQEWARGGFM